ncbi:glycosyltransferase family 4 protein [Candidatus Pacearchaeota archaeon]|nr:glycosyltransferase family 4 protein [Candidatus Pacearchaeota archaeon]
MKILIFAGHFYPYAGGYENHIYQFAEQMSKRGHEISVVTINTSKVKEYERINKNFDIYRLPGFDILGGTYPLPAFNKDFFRIWKGLRMKKWDVIITHTRFFTTSYLGYKFAKKSNVPLIHVEHGSCHTVTDNKIVGMVNRIYDHSIGSLIVKNSRKNIGISPRACEFVGHLGGKKATYIPNGVNANIESKYKVKKEIKNIVFVGRLIYAKGVQDLINAFAELEDKNLKLTIVGDGPYRKELGELTAKLNLKNRINFVGEKDRKEVMKELAKSDLFVNPSYSEGLPTSVLEAGAVGLPVIATDAGGTREVIIDGKTGILIKEKDSNGLKKAIEFMVMNRTKREMYANNLNNLIKEKFDWEKIIKQWEKILRN